jgi:hypothetical protein
MTFTIVGRHRGPRSAMALLSGLALLSSGCYKATGGGWIHSINESTLGNKASFGFNAMCRNAVKNGMPVAVLYDGQLQWHDGPVRFHGAVEPIDEFLVLPGRCQDLRETLAGSVQQFGGTYEPQFGGKSGNFVVVVVDCAKGTVGVDCSVATFDGDFISITLFGGEFGGEGEDPVPYFNDGFVQGGNIRVE